MSKRKPDTSRSTASGPSGARASGRLDRYHEKRSEDRSPEPFGRGRAERPRIFVVQKHDATRLHYDLRLEWGGTLLCWAVPKGFSWNTKENRLAVQTEDHPVEYADFEGVIPDGNYGAGAMIVWDRGQWMPLDDPEEAIESTGVLHFELRGYKLRGGWVLVRPDKNDPRSRDWLLKKRPDDWASESAEPFGEESILSGLTVEELATLDARTDEVRRELNELGAPRRAVSPRKVSFMLAKTGDKPFTSSDWLFELKYDGYRLLASRGADGEPLLLSRNGHDITSTFPEIARAVKSTPYDGLILDGELVVLDDAGRPDFQALQKRAQTRRRLDVERAAVASPATLYAFDLLAFDGFDLRPLPLAARKALLSRLAPRTGPVRFTDHIEAHGEAMYEKVREMGLEGIMAKHRDAPYRGGRSERWLKLPADREGDFVVCGYTRPKGSRAGFGALHLGAYRGDVLEYVGRVGSGFSEDQLDAFRAALESMEREDPPCRGTLPTSAEHRWVQPRMVVNVRYKTWTESGFLRHPVFLRLRDDKPPRECLHPVEDRVEIEPAAVEDEPVDRHVKLTRLPKVFWPEDGYTKGDLIDYYRAVWPWLRTFLSNRPLVLTRYPDGIDGKSFYQKNVPDFVPDWVETVTIWSGSSEKEIGYYVCNDLETLVYVVNSGAIPLHIWSSRVSSLQNPDWCILDLDPKGAPFTHVVTLAKAIRALCRSIGLESFVKTSGSTGLHVLLPLGGQCTYDQSRMLGELLARAVEADHPDIATTARALDARQGKVYLDYLQNRHGQLLVAPYSVRPLPGAPVSAPVRWREVTGSLTAQAYTMKTIVPRLSRQKQDPFAALMTVKPDLVGALARLSERF